MTYRVNIDSDTAFVEHYCHESPWGTVYVFNPILEEWLIERVGLYGWDYETFCYMDEGGTIQGIVLLLENRMAAIKSRCLWGMDL